MVNGGSDRGFDGFAGFMGVGGRVFEGNKAPSDKCLQKHEFLMEKYENPGHSAGFLGFYGVI